MAELASISFSQALVLPMTIRRAIKVSIIVGVILISINQGDLLIQGDWPPVWKIFLTFLVPYSVSSYASAAFISEFSRTHGANLIRPLKSLKG